MAQASQASVESEGKSESESESGASGAPQVICGPAFSPNLQSSSGKEQAGDLFAGIGREM
ncbi:hypothetical protein HJFPF1_06518 [Paramyrothecium foliicola]|nr:hypothetical protein HJFPF1_06518 [Paramyrothecium foliicola]